MSIYLSPRLRKLCVCVLIIFLFIIKTSIIKASTLVYSNGAVSVNNVNGFLVSQIDNKQVYFQFVPGHNYRLDITGAVNPNTFWIGICNDTTINSNTTDNICNPAAGNYSNDGDFSVNFTDIDSQWFDVWGNCSGYGMCSVTGVYLYDLSLNPTSPPTPTPTPTPTLTPVTKVVMVPGLGASWNLADFISCKTGSSSDTWTLAPYAESVYSPLLTALKDSSWEVKPFYYDWRKSITDNAIQLKTFITANAASGERVDLVGHSMGGLVGKSYFEANQGGQLAKFLAVGTPFQGSALTYPPWSGGEIWRSNLIETVALNLYLKHCGGIISNNRQTVQAQFPSVQNLLPTVSYIRDSQTKILKSISSMKAQNNILTNFTSDFWGVKVGAISGKGYPTLSVIDVTSPSKSDIKDGNWLDGKPVNEEYLDGDGTVLTSSSQIPVAGATNITINETHSGLVGTTDGDNKILGFFGSPGVSDPAFNEPTSALIVIGYPGTFTLTDEKGKITPSENGMVAIINPKDGDYQLQTTSTTSQTNLIISQFLPNNQMEYKEYKFNGGNNEPKVIEFNSQYHQADILHGFKDYKNPDFPKFWFQFWKFWNKLYK